MRFRKFFSFLLIFPIASSSSFAFGLEDLAPKYSLEREPIVRIGLITNTSSVLISTVGETLVSSAPGEPVAVLDTKSVRLTSRPYRAPDYDLFRFELDKVQSRNEAEEHAARIRTMTGESALVTHSSAEASFKISIGSAVETKTEADEFLARLTENGVEDVKIVVERFTSPSDEAIELSQQIRNNPRSEVRSLVSDGPVERVPSAARVRTIASSASSWRKNANAPINPSLREVVISGATPQSKFASLKSVTVGTPGTRGIVRLNGKSYRGAIEVFVNSKGGLTVVNAVPMEDYLLGVVPAELSLPQLEAQKAQAVAARTYAVANKNAYWQKGFDMLPTVWSQVYKGVSIESKMGTKAVLETRGVVATYRNTPINALYTSTCGGRTEDSGNIFEFNEPYLRGVECSLEGRQHFVPFMVKTSREPAVIRNEANYDLVRLSAKYAVNNFLMATPRFSDDYFEDPPTEVELRSWLNQLASKFGKPFPVVDQNTSRPLPLAKTLYGFIYTPDAAADADALLTESDIEYQLSFLDATEVPKRDRPWFAELLRDGWFSIYADLTIKPNKHYSRGKILRLIDHIYNKKRWAFEFESGTANPTEDGKLMLKAGRSEKQLTLNPNLYLFRKFGDAFYQVKEAALVGGETVRFKSNAAGEVVYLEVEPTEKPTVAERMSPFTNWHVTVAASTVRARLGRYVKGLGELIDVTIKKRGFSRRPIELEIRTTNGVHTLKGGTIRSALRLREQLFVMDKRYGNNGRVVSFSFRGRGWGHGVGMCQYGAYGLAQMGVKYEDIIRHYYTGTELSKAY